MGVVLRSADWLKRRAVSACMAAALLALARVWLDIGWRPLLLRALDAVSATFDLIQLLLLSWWVPSLIAALSALVPWDLHLPSDWRNLFTLLTLYLSSHVREAGAPNVPNRALALSWRILAALVGLVLATSLAVLLASGGFDRLETAVMGSVLGIVIIGGIPLPQVTSTCCGAVGVLGVQPARA